MKVVKTSKVTLTFASGDTVQNGTLSGYSTLSKTIPFTASSSIGAASVQIAQTAFDIEVTSLTNVRATRGASGVAASVVVYVVEFSSDTTVQKDTWSMAAASTSASITLSAVTMANAFIIPFRKCTTASTLQPDDEAIGFELTTTTNVAVSRIGSTGAFAGHVYTVEDSDLSVQRGSKTSDTNNDDIAISSVTLGESFVMVSHTTTETQYEDEGIGFCTLDTATGLKWYVGYTSGDNVIKWQVISDSDLTVQRANGRNTSTASGNATVTSVDTDFSVVVPGNLMGFNASSLYDNAADMSARSTKLDLSSATNVAWAKTSEVGSWNFELVEFDEYTSPGPTITDIGTDEDIYVGETGVTITGTTFEADGTNSRVRLNASSDGTGTDQVQTDTSWADTSIEFTVSKGSLSYGTNYAFVRNHSSQENAAGFSVNVFLTLSTSGLNKSSIYNGTTGVELSGTNFNATQGTSKLYLCDSADGSGTNVAQTVTTWADTKVTFTVVRGALATDSTVYALVARNQSSLGDTGERFTNSQSVTMLGAPAFEYSLSTQIAQNESTTRQLTAQTGDFVAGKCAESDNPESIDQDGLEYTEVEICFQATADAESSVAYEFRIVDDTQSGETLNAYDEVPKITLT